MQQNTQNNPRDVQHLSQEDVFGDPRTPEEREADERPFMGCSPTCTDPRCPSWDEAHAKRVFAWTDEQQEQAAYDNWQMGYGHRRQEDEH